MAITLQEAKEYLRVGYDDDNDYITELIDISEAYIDGCVGTAYREKDKYNSEEEYKRGCRLATLLQKKVISDMYDVRGTTVSNNTKQDNCKKWRHNKRPEKLGENMEEDRYLKVNEAEKPKEEESPVIEKTTVRLFNTEAGEMKIEEEKEVV